jgi:hypothetical protein
MRHDVTTQAWHITQVKSHDTTSQYHADMKEEPYNAQVYQDDEENIQQTLATSNHVTQP